MSASVRRSSGPLHIMMLGIRAIPTDPGLALPPPAHPMPDRGVMGGAERAVERLSVELVRRGHRVTVLCRAGRELTSLRNFEGVELRPLPCLLSRSAEALSHSALGALFAGARRPDLLHITATGPALMSGISRALGVPTVVTVQGLDWRREKWGAVARRVLKAGAWAAGALPQRTIVVSQFLQRHYAERYGASVDYIPNGVDIPERVPPGALLDRLGLHPRGYALFLSRLVPEKGAHLLIDAFKRVPGEERRLVIAGEGSFTDGYVEQLRKAAAEDPRILMPGGLYDADKAEIFSNAAGFVLPSSIEGLSIALLEAMSYGLRPLTSDIPENAEVSLPAGGHTFRDADVDSLAAALPEVFTPGDADALREHVRERYAWEVIAEQTEALYRAI